MRQHTVRITYVQVSRSASRWFPNVSSLSVCNFFLSSCPYLFVSNQSITSRIDNKTSRQCVVNNAPMEALFVMWHHVIIGGLYTKGEWWIASFQSLPIIIFLLKIKHKNTFTNHPPPNHYPHQLTTFTTNPTWGVPPTSKPNHHPTNQQPSLSKIFNQIGSGFVWLDLDRFAPKVWIILTSPNIWFVYSPANRTPNQFIVEGSN